MLNLCIFFSAVSSGSVTINEDSSVQVLAQEAVPVEKLDAQVSILIFIVWFVGFFGFVFVCLFAHF